MVEEIVRRRVDELTCTSTGRTCSASRCLTLGFGLTRALARASSGPNMQYTDGALRKCHATEAPIAARSTRAALRGPSPPSAPRGNCALRRRSNSRAVCPCRHEHRDGIRELLGPAASCCAGSRTQRARAKERRRAHRAAVGQALDLLHAPIRQVRKDLRIHSLLPRSLNCACTDPARAPRSSCGCKPRSPLGLRLRKGVPSATPVRITRPTPSPPKPPRVSCCS